MLLRLGKYGAILWGSQAAQWLRICLQCRRRGFDPWVGKIPWKSKWHPTPIFLPEKIPLISQWESSQVGHNPWDHKESDTSKQAQNPTMLFYIKDSSIQGFGAEEGVLETIPQGQWGMTNSRLNKHLSIMSKGPIFIINAKRCFKLIGIINVGLLKQVIDIFEYIYIFLFNL